MEELDLELSKIIGLDELKVPASTMVQGHALGPEPGGNLGRRNLGHRNLPHIRKLLSSVGVQYPARVTEVQPTDLVSQHSNQTRLKARKKMYGVESCWWTNPLQKLQQATLHTGTKIMYAIEEGSILVIFTGCTEPMKRVFSSNKGFCRVVTRFFQFNDLSCMELAEMLMLKMNKQDERSRVFGMRLGSCCCVEAVASVIERKTSERMRSKMNGGLVDDMLNNGRDNLDSRLGFEAKGDELLTITLADLEAGLDQLVRRLSVSRRGRVGK